MVQKFTRNQITWLAYFMLAFYGFFLNILGPITPFLKEELRLSYTVSSLHFSAFAVGMLLAGLGGHLIVRRFGQWRTLWIGAAGLSLGALLLTLGQTPVLTIGAAFVMGTVGSLVLTLVPSILSEQHGELRAVALSEANVISSIVSTAAPFLVGWFAQYAGSWRLALAFGAFAPLLLGLLFHKASLPRAVLPPANEPRPAKASLSRLFWVYWLALVLAVSIEFCMVSWSADFMETGLGVPKVTAAQAVGLFLGGMIIGRMAGSRLVRRFATQNVVTGAIFLSAAGFLLYWKSGSPLPAAVGLFITGLGVASLYPLILAMAIGASNNQTVLASARTTLASGTAILALPLALGRLADAFGIQAAFGIVAVLLLLVFLIIQVTVRITHSSR
jgi:fucose permease